MDPVMNGAHGRHYVERAGADHAAIVRLREMGCHDVEEADAVAFALGEWLSVRRSDPPTRCETIVSRVQARLERAARP
jgi:hypothetical protein